MKTLETDCHTDLRRSKAVCGTPACRRTKPALAIRDTLVCQVLGTTNDKSKFLPVSKEALNDTHYQGGKDAVALYLGQNPDSRFFSGQGLILGGSHSPNLNSRHGLVAIFLLS